MKKKTHSDIKGTWLWIPKQYIATKFLENSVCVLQAFCSCVDERGCRGTD